MKINNSIKKKICITILVGKPNVGKSTLFNKLVNKKISITSKKKFTTQKNIFGINSKKKKKQYIYIDTPGFNSIQEFNKNINKSISVLKKFNILLNINLILLIIKKEKYNEELIIINKLNLSKIPYIILINKVDKIKNKLSLLPYIKKIQYFSKKNIILPICSKKKKDIKILKKIIKKYLIKSNFSFNKKIKTIHSYKFIFKEIIREKTLRLIGDEIPYFIKFKIKNILKQKKNINIQIIIFVKKKQYINILIGKSGKKIKKIIFLSQKSIRKYLNFKYNIYIYINIKKYKK